MLVSQIITYTNVYIPPKLLASATWCGRIEAPTMVSTLAAGASHGFTLAIPSGPSMLDESNLPFCPSSPEWFHIFILNHIKRFHYVSFIHRLHFSTSSRASATGAARARKPGRLLVLRWVDEAIDQGGLPRPGRGLGVSDQVPWPLDQSLDFMRCIFLQRCRNLLFVDI